MTEQQAGEMCIDNDQVELARLALAVPSKDDQVIQIRDRLSKGMALIQECTNKLAYFSNGNQVPYKVWMAWVDRRTHLWNHWHVLKAQCVALDGEQLTLWPEVEMAKAI